MSKLAVHNYINYLSTSLKFLFLLLNWLAGRSDYTFGLSRKINFPIMTLKPMKINGMLSFCSVVMIKNTLLILTYAIS